MTRDGENTHVPNCEADECGVCASWLRETRDWVLPLLAACRLHRRRAGDDGQATLEDWARET